MRSQSRSSSLTVVALVDVTAVFSVGSLVGCHVNVGESALPGTSFWHLTTLHAEEVKAAAPITGTAERFTLSRRSLGEDLVVVPNNPPAGDLSV